MSTALEQYLALEEAFKAAIFIGNDEIADRLDAEMARIWYRLPERDLDWLDAR